MMRLVLLAMLAQAPPAQHDSLRAVLLAAEDARAGTLAQETALLEALHHSDPTIQQQAVRALGRLERTEYLPHLATMLGAEGASVRSEAANAIAQAAYRSGADSALAILRGRLPVETDPAVRAALLAGIGRLAVPDAAFVEVEELLLPALSSSSDTVRAGAARGTYDLLRRQNRGRSTSPQVVAALRHMVISEPRDETRRVALLALLTTGRLDSPTATAALQDPDMQVRLLAAQAARTHRELPGRELLAERAREDSSALVRIEGVRAAISPGIRELLGCEPLIEALDDASLHVQLLAINAMGQGCPPATPPLDLLDSIAREPITEEAWHRPAAAIVALATVDTARASIRLARFTVSPVWWARVAAAHAAARLRDTGTLQRLAADSSDNVREAALQGLVSVPGSGADRVALRQLERADYQLLLTAARTLRASPLGAVVAREALAAFERVTLDSAETSRDARMALLDRVAEFGAALEGERLRLALTDFDPAVAERAAAIITQLTGQPAVAAPRLRHPLPLPSPAALRTMRRAVIVMADGGRMELVLHPESAPTNVARFIRMARHGWFNGLTLHRVVPNFVVQGGSPGANEYVGAPEFSRDEVGGSHRRGTVGISTRGRDTGDGQLFINLVDNLRLDHEYTVIGQVVSGWEVLDRILEGAVIAAIEIRSP
ncbi:MAG TPA: peptidylprolyl isomerase [Gemmatimonadales bacterium]|nr:peptidylprolyl isomerase [Gemmatimonadales bacterium]